MTKVKSPKFTNGELSVMRIMVAATVDTMKGGTATTKKDYASLTEKLRQHEGDVYKASTPKKKPLTKKEIKGILKSVLPKDSKDRGDFLVKLQQNINTVFN